MKRYEAYKDSGVKWIGEIPSHWETVKAKRVVQQVVAHSSDINKIGLENIESFTGKFIPTESVYEGDGIDVNVGDIVYGKLRPYLCKAWLATFQCNAVGDFYVFRCYKANTEYIHRLFLSYPFTQVCNSSTYGAKMPRVSSSFILSLPLPIPPLHEQQAIADYLKDKTSKIEQYVAERERERELLDSLKQSEIANVVTKGLNPDVPMKDSGIPWIGEIPAHWEVLRAKNMFCKEKREVRENDEVITCFRDGQVTLRKNRRTTGFTESFTEYGYQGVRKGDLVIHQMDAFAGAIGVSDSDGKGTSVYHCCTPKGDYNVYYYAFLLRRMAQSGYIQSLYRGIRERSSDFKFTVFGVQYLPVPPLSEQQAIVDYIDARLVKIDQHIAGLTAEIEYLKEFKQRLIIDAVTGQIKVTDETKTT